MSMSHDMRMAIIKLDKKLGDHDAGQKYWVIMTLHMVIMTLDKKGRNQWAYRVKILNKKIQLGHSSIFWVITVLENTLFQKTSKTYRDNNDLDNDLGDDF